MNIKQHNGVEEVEVKPAPARVKIWPFTAVDRIDGEKAWSGGYWGDVSATMSHATEYVRADLVKSLHPEGAA